MADSHTTLLIAAIAFLSTPVNAANIVNQKIEGGILGMDDYDMIASSRLTDVHIILESGKFNSFVGDQLSGDTYLTVDGKDYKGGKAIAAEFEKLGKDCRGRFYISSMFFDIPEPKEENNLMGQRCEGDGSEWCFRDDAYGTKPKLGWFCLSISDGRCASWGRPHDK